MEGGSVRRNIALKLKEPAAIPSVKAQPTNVIIDNTPANETKKKPVSTVSAIHKAWETLQWDQPLNLIGRGIVDPLIHICEQCDLPILIYGRMKHCRHTFCRDCAKKAGGECPKCHESNQQFDEALMGNVYICTFGGGRYDNKGCGRSYLSQRDLDAHIAYRHKKDKSIVQLPAAPPPPLAPLPNITALQGFFPTANNPRPPLNFPPSLARGPPNAPLHPLPLPGFPAQQPRFVAPPTSANWTRPPPTGFQ